MPVMVIERLRPSRAWRLRRSHRSPLIYIAMVIVGLGAAVLIAIIH
jgi:hypothetical protein